jgi:hypothetical protein
MSDRRTRADHEPSQSSDLWADAEVIFRYTRAQALDDGVLVAVPAALATEAGFRWPIALTAAAWADTVAWDEDTEARKPSPTGQDETGRLWDVLTMTRHAEALSRYCVFRPPAAQCVPSWLACTSSPGQATTGSRC